MTRVVLSLCCYTWIRWEAKGLAEQMGHGQMLLETYLGAYVVYSLLALVLLHLIGRAHSTAYSVTTQIIDIFVGAAITVFTGPVESPSWILGVFAAVSAAYRWGLPQIWLTSAAWALLLLVDAIVLQFWAYSISQTQARPVSRSIES